MSPHPPIAQIPDLKIDPITLDIIENALRHARFEMDAVLFRSAMSPVIREQHDEFPMITDPNGRMVVGQFGAYISQMMEEWDRGIYPGDVILTSDPYKCSASISHTNDWLVLVPIFFEDEIVGWSSQFGHQMDAGGRLPGSLPTGATTVFEEGIIIPPLKIIERGEVQEDILRLILNNVRLPQMNRADLFAIVAGCRAGEKRVVELCERFGKDVYLAALQALLDRTHEAMRKLILMAIPEEPQSFEDWIDDDGLGNGPYKMKLTIWREGEHAWFDWSGTDPQALGPINFYLSEGMFKMFIGVYLIMVNDPQILFNDGFYPLLHVVMPEGCLLAPRYPAALGCRTHGLTRLFDVLGGALCKQAPELNTAAGYGTSPYMLYSGWKEDGEFFYAMEILYGGHPRQTDRRRDGRPLLVAAVREHPDRVPRGLLPLAHRRLHDGDGQRRRRLPPWRQRRREALRLPRAGPRLDPRRALAHAAVGRARRPARRALEQAAAARRRQRAGAAVQVRRGRGPGRRHARLPHRRGRRLEGPAGPAGGVGGARRGLRARLAREGAVGVRGRAGRRGGHRGRAGAAAGRARRGQGVRLRARDGRRAGQLRGRDGPEAAAAGDAAALVAARVGRRRPCARARGLGGRDLGGERAPMTGAGGFGGGAGFGSRPAVVVVDLLEGFTDPESPLGADLDDVVASTRTLLDAARDAGVPVLFTTVVYDDANERAAAVFIRKVPALRVLRPGSRWIEVDARLGRRDDEPVLAKAFASAFFGTPLASMLVGCDTLVVCGASTSGCVRATVVDAVQHGLAPIVPRECVGDRWPDAHDASLFDIEAKYGDVVPMSAAVGAMHEAGQRAAEDA